MGRVELLFGEMASTRKVDVRRHAPPDYALPLRMQAAGRGKQKRLLARWRVELWKTSLRSKPAWGRASIFSLAVIALQTLVQTDLWKIGLIAITTFAIALLSAAWTEVTLTSQRWDARKN